MYRTSSLLQAGIKGALTWPPGSLHRKSSAFQHSARSELKTIHAKLRSKKNRRTLRKPDIFPDVDRGVQVPMGTVCGRARLLVESLRSKMLSLDCITCRHSVSFQYIISCIWLCFTRFFGTSTARSGTRDASL